VGFEVPFSLSILGNLGTNASAELARKWGSEQIRRCFNPATRNMDMCTEDPITHTARIYELARMPLEVLEATVIKW